LLLLVPAQGPAVALTTNSVSGSGFHRTIETTVLKVAAGVVEPEPPTVGVTSARLQAYTGRYERPFMAVIVTTDGHRLLIQSSEARIPATE
jgi:hypothetical protein